MLIFFIIVAIIVVSSIKAIKDNYKSSNPANQPGNNRYPQRNGPYYTNQNPMVDSHLCDDNQHGQQNAFLGDLSSYTGTMNSGVPLSKYEKERDLEELKDLLGAGIISQEEYVQRKRML